MTKAFSEKAEAKPIQIHETASELAGKSVRIKGKATHNQVPDFGGAEYEVEDWWDRLGQGSWKWCKGNPACLVYAIRSVGNELPPDDEVLYGKIGHFGYLVHISEIEGRSNGG